VTNAHMKSGCVRGSTQKRFRCVFTLCTGIGFGSNLRSYCVERCERAHAHTRNLTGLMTNGMLVATNNAAIAALRQCASPTARNSLTAY
jgi:hypothetical protein